MKGELAEAEQLLHQALRRAHREENRQAIIYTYSMVSSGPWALFGVQLEGEGEAAEARPRCLGGASAVSVSSRWGTWPTCRDSWTM